MVAQIGGFDGLESIAKKHGEADIQQTRPVRPEAMAVWSKSHRLLTEASSFRKIFEEVKWEETQFGPREGWDPSLRQSQ